MRDPEGLIARVKQMRRTGGTAPQTPAPSPKVQETGRLDALETRVAHLEGLLEGFQDSVHRESERQTRRLAELEARLEPSALAVTLSRDARERGL
jgi:uncharacterized coiled-coil protein SlyX